MPGLNTGAYNTRMQAVIYCRVSSDQTGQARSVESQEHECRAVCERMGWTVTEVLVDNDRSASKYATKDRPEYKRLEKVLKKGMVLVTWENSRLSRDMGTLVALRDLCLARGVQLSYEGQLVELEGMKFLIDGMLSEQEAKKISERVLRGKRAAALTGRPSSRPPWGYRREIDPVTGKTVNWVIDEDDGPIVKEVIERVLDGQSLWSIVRDLEARGIKPRQVQKNAAKKWMPQPLRVTICSPTYAGLRKHQGEIIGKGTWEPMISVEQHERLVALLSDPARRTNHRGPEPRHLLTGIALCGVCGATMRYGGSPNTYRTGARYLCNAKNCVGRKVEPVDLLVTETILARLERKDAIKLLAPKRSNSELKAALVEADTLRQRLASFVDQAADGKISAASLATIEAKLLPQIEAAEAKAQTHVESPLVAKLASPDARAIWENFSVADRRTVVKSLITVTINKTIARGGNVAFIPEDIDITWNGASA